MGNRIHELSAAGAVALGIQLHSTVSSSPATYGVSLPYLAALLAALEGLQSAMTDQEAAKAAARSATEAKDETLLTAVTQIADMAATIYANETLTNSQIAATGLQPRDTTRTKVTPVEIADLIATPNANGTVSLTWNRNGNKPGVLFVIETSQDGENWSSIFMTSKTRTTLTGFNPGDAAYFRVFATKNDIASQPSGAVSIYLVAPGGNGMYLAA